MQAIMEVRFRNHGSEVVDYSVILLVAVGDSRQAVRVYDAAHRFNEMHRYTQRDGKQPGVPFHEGTLGEGMRTAIDEVKNKFPQMIEGWMER
jgi:hypothetical protein